MADKLIEVLRPKKDVGEFWVIGESLNVIGTKIGKAFKERDPKPIQEEALFQKSKGVDMIDINLGPAKKDGHELMPWVVEVVQEVVDDVPLVLDTSNIDAIEAALPKCKMPKMIKLHHGPAGALRAHGAHSGEVQRRFLRPDVGPRRPAAGRKRARRPAGGTDDGRQRGRHPQRSDVGGRPRDPRQHPATPGHQPDELHGHAAGDHARGHEHLRGLQHLQRHSGSSAARDERHPSRSCSISTACSPLSPIARTISPWPWPTASGRIFSRPSRPPWTAMPRISTACPRKSATTSSPARSFSGKTLFSDSWLEV